MAKLEKVSVFDQVTRYCYQPNNGTRYVVLYCPGSVSFLLGLFGSYGTAGGRLAEFSNGGLLTCDYFMQKLGITNQADAAALLTLVNCLSGRPVELPIGYDPTGNLR